MTAISPKTSPLQVEPARQILSLSLTVFALLLALLALQAEGDGLLRDPDIFWHIEVGRRILQTGSVPWIDELSHTFAGHTWVAKEWLSQVIFALVYEAGGWRAVFALCIGAIALTFALMFAELARQMRPAVALSIVMLSYSLSSFYFLARPHILSYPIAVLWLAGLVRAAENWRAPNWFLLPLMIFWVNLHGGFTLGLGIGGLLAIEAIIESERSQRLQTLLRWSAFLGAATIATFITPYGYHSGFVSASASILLATVKYEALNYINEWQAFNFAKEVFMGPLIIGLIFLSLWLGVKIKFMRLVIVSILFYMMLVHIRLVSIFALVTPIMIASSLIAKFPYLSRQSQREDQPGFVDDMLQRSKPFYSLILLFFVAGPALLSIYVRDINPRHAITPAAAVDFLLRTDPDGKVYHDFSFNGYLIFRGIKTFIDGRTDQLFGGGFMTRVFEAGRSPNDELLKLLDDHKITSAVVVPESGQAVKLDKSHFWLRRYEDTTAVVFQRIRD